MAGETALARRCPLSFPGPFHHGRSPAGGGVGPALRGDRVIQAIEVAAISPVVSGLRLPDQKYEPGEDQP
jgi:hypothetical protein